MPLGHVFILPQTEQEITATAESLGLSPTDLMVVDMTDKFNGWGMECIRIADTVMRHGFPKPARPEATKALDDLLLDDSLAGAVELARSTPKPTPGDGLDLLYALALSELHIGSVEGTCELLNSLGYDANSLQYPDLCSLRAGIKWLIENHRDALVTLAEQPPAYTWANQE